MYIWDGHINSRIFNGVSLELPRRYSATRILLETIRVHGIDGYRYRRSQVIQHNVQGRTSAPKPSREHTASIKPSTPSETATLKRRIDPQAAPIARFEQSRYLRCIPELYQHTAPRPVKFARRYTTESDYSRTVLGMSKPAHENIDGRQYQPCPCTGSEPFESRTEARLGHTHSQYGSRSFRRPEAARSNAGQRRMGSRYVYIYDR